MYTGLFMNDYAYMLYYHSYVEYLFNLCLCISYMFISAAQ